MNKICPICGTEFEPNFHTRKYCSDECSKIANRRNATKYKQEHKEEISIRRRKSYKQNPEKWKEIRKKQYREHREDRLKQAHEYYIKNKDRIREYKKQWYQDRKLKKQIAECSSKHNNCFNCPTENGDCMYE